MPTTSPFRLKSGPPELPGLTATSVWMKGVYASPPSVRAVPLTMPAVTEFWKPNGEPIAITHSPTLRPDGSPVRTYGRPRASILSTATSVRESTPTTFARDSRRAVLRTVTRPARPAEPEAPEELVQRIVRRHPGNFFAGRALLRDRRHVDDRGPVGRHQRHEIRQAGDRDPGRRARVRSGIRCGELRSGRRRRGFLAAAAARGEDDQAERQQPAR